ncbi:MAG: OmpP1/FadL family transporter [Saprospiraceae bacterium]
MTRLFALLTTLMFSCLSLNAQVVDDALRYSRLEFGGTARSMGVGGALGALGTDFAVLSTNPAGLAAYRSSDFMFTPTFKFMNTSSTLAGNSAKDDGSVRLLLDNIGYVYASQPLETKWEALNFGIGTNKIADFFQEFSYEGSSRGSIVDRFAEQANGFTPDGLYPFEEGLAYDAVAIYDDDGDAFYETDFQLNPNAAIQREETVKTTGAINELVLSFAGNYNHKLMIGATVGIPLLRYRIERTYQESDPRDEVPFFNNLTYNETVETNGAGINLKLGVIYRPIQALRVGVAYHSPTRFQLTDEWETSFGYDYTFFDLEANEEVNVPAEPFYQAPGGGPFEYDLTTPSRWIGSLAFLFQKRGFLTAEMEYLNYGNSSFNLTKEFNDTQTQLDERILNQEVENTFDSAINLKLGGEVAVDIFRIRAGYGMFGTSYADKSSFDPNYSFGVGMRQESFYLDLAYRRSTFSNDYTPYRLVEPTEEQQVANEANINKIIMTLGFRF